MEMHVQDEVTYHDSISGIKPKRLLEALEHHEEEVLPSLQASDISLNASVLRTIASYKC